MDLRVFEKSPGVAPLLVKLYENHKLYGLARDNKPAARAELTGAVAELLEIDLSSRERELLTDVLTSLMRQAETDLRQALAERLAAIGTVPLRLALQLANDDIPVAAPMLRGSPVLSDLDLVYIIKSQGPAYWQAIAERDMLSPQLVDILVDTKDVDTAVSLSENERIRLTSHAAETLAILGRQHEEVARPLLARPELPERLVRDLYEYVGQELRSHIRTFHGIDGAEAQNAVEEILLEFVQPVAESEFMPTDKMFAQAERYAALGMLNLNLMLDSLNKGQIPSFIALFSQFTGIPARRVHNFLKQGCPKGLAISCKAFGIPKADFSRIYLMTNRMRSKERVINHADMLEILGYFDKIKADVAIRIIENETGAVVR